MNMRHKCVQDQKVRIVRLPYAKVFALTVGFRDSALEVAGERGPAEILDSVFLLDDLVHLVGHDSGHEPFHHCASVPPIEDRLPKSPGFWGFFRDVIFETTPVGVVDVHLVGQTHAAGPPLFIHPLTAVVERSKKLH